MQLFVDNDQGYLEWIWLNRDNEWVVNTHRKPNPTNMRLHRASCGMISGSPANGANWTKNYIKVCGSEQEVRRWAEHDERGTVWRCSRCT